MPLSKKEDIAFFKNLRIFSDLTPIELRALTKIASIVAVAPNVQLLRAGDPGKNIYIFLSGEATVTLNNGLLTFPGIRKNGIAGEFSFFTNQPNSADVITSCSSKLICLNHIILKQTIDKHPHLGLKMYRNFSKEILAKFNLLTEQVTDLILGNASKQVAHDIRSPLAALKSFAECMPKNQNSDRELLFLVIERIDRIAATLLNSEFKNTSQSAWENKNKSISILQVCNCLTKIINEKRLKLGKQSQIKIVFNSASYKRKDPSFFIVTNILELGRILSNLLDNSIQAIKAKGTIEIKLELQDNVLFLTIRDNGIGFSKTLISKIGSTRVSHGKKNGHGMGLFHAHHQLKRWGATLQIESKINQGSKVTLLFPRVT